MPKLSDTTSEEFDQDERAIESSADKDPFVTHVSVTIAVLAVVGVILGSLESMETSAAGAANDQAVLHQDRATDAWGAFEAKNIKMMLEAYAPDAAAGRNGPNPKLRERFADHDAEALSRLAQEQERLSQASLREASERSERHHILTMAVTMVQIAIAIATISIIARGTRWPWYAAMALGTAGALVGDGAYVLG